MKRALRFLSSMRFALIIMIALAVICCISSFIPQNQPVQWYFEQYQEWVANLILFLNLNDAYHSLWFILPACFLCINLLFCNLVRIPQLHKKCLNFISPEYIGTYDYSEDGIISAEEFFKELHMPVSRHIKNEQNQIYMYSTKFTVGFWGAWVCHLGIFLLILGFSLGQVFHQQWIVYGVPGHTESIGNTGYELKIDSFDIELREDDTVKQYTSNISVFSERTNSFQNATVQVNNPAKIYGMKFYQNSTGWAAKVSIKKGDEVVQEKVICADEYLQVEDIPGLVLFFNAFYPDYVLIPGKGPSTQSGKINNPAYLYTLYYQDRILGMNVLMGHEAITIDQYSILFSDPQAYTLIQIKKDPYTGFALLGGLMTLVGLLFAFYLRPVRATAVCKDNNHWLVQGVSPKGGPVFKEKFYKAVSKAREENVL